MLRGLLGFTLSQALTAQTALTITFSLTAGDIKNIIISDRYRIIDYTINLLYKLLGLCHKSLKFISAAGNDISGTDIQWLVTDRCS